MPYLKAILVNATDKSNRMLRAKSMECISLVGMAVGKEKFRADAKQVGVSCLFLYFVKQEYIMYGFVLYVHLLYHFIVIWKNSRSRTGK